MKKSILIIAILTALCLLCTSCCCLTQSSSKGLGNLFSNRTVCGICGGTGVQQTVISVDPFTGVPQYGTIGCGGCGGSGYIG